MSKACSNLKFKEIFEETGGKPGQQIQKYHDLIIKGLALNKGVKVKALSLLPYPLSVKKFIFSEDEHEENVEYKYFRFLNFPILRQGTIFLSSYLKIKKEASKNKNSIIICDVLNISIATAAVLVSKISKINNVCIVTDVPGYMVINKKNQVSKTSFLKKMTTKYNNYILSNFKSYVFLTEQMNDLLNPTKKPYSIIEGQVDYKMDKSENLLANKSNTKVCLYAGILSKQFGIDILISAFNNVTVPNCELHLYGDGPFESEIKEISKINNRIKFFGTQPNNLVVNEQLKATLLINTRPTKEEYTKYSFPSKNMEYMASGTPVLTTKLPGMPTSYYDFVYILEEESIKGLTKKLNEILSIPVKELHEKGRQTKEYVLAEKNNVKQSTKIINLINTLNKGDF